MASLNWLDRAIGYVAPRTALKRVHARSVLDEIAAGRRRYEGARRDGRFISSRSDATSEALAAGASLRENARDLVRNNTLAGKALDSWASHAAPISARAQIQGIDRRQAKALHEPIDTLWWEWCQRASYDGTMTFDAMQALGVRSLIENGEYLLRRIDRPRSFKLPVPFQLQFMEPDYLDVSQDRAIPEGNIIIGGIEHDRQGRRVAYWLHTEHPGSARVFTRLAPRSVRVPADQITHVYEPRRFDQVRGISWFAPALIRLRHLDEYDEAELVRKKIEACFVAFVSTDAEGIDETLGQTKAEKTPDGERIETFEPGQIHYSTTPRQVQFGEPKAVGGYPEYVRVQDRRCAAALSMTYELWTGDLSQVNFSSARMGVLQFRARVRQVQNTVLIPKGCDPVWNWFVDHGQAAGLLPMRTIWSRWAPPQWESVQPLDDATEEMMRARTGSLSMPEALAKRGYDWMETLDEIEQWNTELDRRGIRLDSDPRNLTKSGVVQAAATETASVDETDPAADEAEEGPGEARARNSRRVNGHHDTLRLAQSLIARREAEERPH